MRISDWSSDVCSSDLFELDMIVDASRFRALAGDLELFLRQGDPQHVNAAFFVQVQGHAAPTAAYVKHSLAGFQRQLGRSEEHTSELQSLMRISYAVFCLKKIKKYNMFTNAKNIQNI